MVQGPQSTWSILEAMFRMVSINGSSIVYSEFYIQYSTFHISQSKRSASPLWIA